MPKHFRISNCLVRIEDYPYVLRSPFECVLLSPVVWVLELKVSRPLTVQRWSELVSDALSRHRRVFARIRGQGATLTLFVETMGCPTPFRLEPAFVAMLASRDLAFEHYHGGA